MRDPYRTLRGAPVVVHLTSGRSLAGTLWDSRRGAVELRAAVELAGQRSVPLDGSVCVPHASIDFYQHGAELTGVAVRAVA